MTIKQEPEWMIEEEYAPSQLYKEDSSVAYTEYEIKPYYDSDIDFDYYKCKVGFYLFIFFFFFFYLFINLIGDVVTRIINDVLETNRIIIIFC